jgi:hypothetical protein
MTMGRVFCRFLTERERAADIADIADGPGMRVPSSGISGPSVVQPAFSCDLIRGSGGTLRSWRGVGGRRRVGAHLGKPPYIELGQGRTAERIPILHEDRAVIAIDKPVGWMLVPFTWQKTNRNLQAAIQSSIGAGAFWARSRQVRFLRYIHRLDADTTGILLFGRSPGRGPEHGGAVRIAADVETLPRGRPRAAAVRRLGLSVETGQGPKGNRSDAGRREPRQGGRNGVSGCWRGTRTGRWSRRVR